MTITDSSNGDSISKAIKETTTSSTRGNTLHPLIQVLTGFLMVKIRQYRFKQGNYFFFFPLGSFDAHFSQKVRNPLVLWRTLRGPENPLESAGSGMCLMMYVVFVVDFEYQASARGSEETHFMK